MIADLASLVAALLFIALAIWAASPPRRRDIDVPAGHRRIGVDR